ncbi:MAG: hypothetical protein F6J93_13875 [Oscillatoria sp. SIO1A7]|nr:hypothetical protein [Oscillatoria sp. SIO1A7]
MSKGCLGNAVAPTPPTPLHPINARENGEGIERFMEVYVKPDFDAMSKSDLRAYILAHRDDKPQNQHPSGSCI